MNFEASHNQLSAQPFVQRELIGTSLVLTHTDLDLPRTVQKGGAQKDRIR